MYLNRRVFVMISPVGLYCIADILPLFARLVLTQELGTPQILLASILNHTTEI